MLSRRSRRISAAVFLVLFILLYSFGPDTPERPVDEVLPGYRPPIRYEPTNGTMSRGDLFTTVPLSRN